MAGPWFYAQDRDTECWSYGGDTRAQCIEAARGDLGDDEAFYITTGHPSVADDDCDPEEFPYTMDSGAPVEWIDQCRIKRQRP